MIKRIVKLSFKESVHDLFPGIFENAKPVILKEFGCNKVRLWKDKGETGVYFTISEWDSEDELNKYRKSDFFKNTWSKTKIMFEQKAEAWTVSPL
jgi:heme-degrading monooxygenase HmoA